MTCPNIITSPIAQTIFPAIKKIIKDAILVEKLSVLAIAVEFIMPCPRKETPAKAKNDPVPGPKNPS